MTTIQPRNASPRDPAERYFIMFEVAGWPKDQCGPVKPPPELVHRLWEAERQVDSAWKALCFWQRETEKARQQSWLKFHDKNGWPEITGYKERMEQEYRVNQK